MFQEFLSAAQSVQALTTLLKAANGLSNYNEIVAAVAEVNARLMQAQSVGIASLEKQQELTSRITELEKKVAEAEGWKSQLLRYRLHEFPTGALAYALREEMKTDEPFHYLCTNCADVKRQISRLHLLPNGRHLKCLACEKSIQIGHAPDSGPSPRSGGSWMS